MLDIKRHDSVIATFRALIAGHEKFVLKMKKNKLGPEKKISIGGELDQYKLYFKRPDVELAIATAERLFLTPASEVILRVNYKEDPVPLVLALCGLAIALNVWGLHGTRMNRSIEGALSFR